MTLNPVLSVKMPENILKALSLAGFFIILVTKVNALCMFFFISLIVAPLYSGPSFPKVDFDPQ